MDTAKTIERRVTLAGSEWWYYLARIQAERPRGNLARFDLIRMNGGDFSDDLADVLIQTDKHTTTIIVRTTPTDKAQWWAILDSLEHYAADVYELRRLALGRTFKDIIIKYYAAKERGERPQLKQMAEAAGVKYASLRAAKVRYDREKGNH